MIVDAGVIVVLADVRDRRHPKAREVMEHRRTKIVTDAILAEADYFIRKYLGQDVELAFLESIDDILLVEPSTVDDRARAREVCSQYGDLDLGYTDGLSVAIAERLGERQIATFDRRDFTPIRPRHIDVFEIIP